MDFVSLMGEFADCILQDLELYLYIRQLPFAETTQQQTLHLLSVKFHFGIKVHPT